MNILISTDSLQNDMVRNLRHTDTDVRTHSSFVRKEENQYIIWQFVTEYNHLEPFSGSIERV